MYPELSNRVEGHIVRPVNCKVRIVSFGRNEKGNERTSTWGTGLGVVVFGRTARLGGWVVADPAATIA